MLIKLVPLCVIVTMISGLNSNPDTKHQVLLNRVLAKMFTCDSDNGIYCKIPGSHKKLQQNCVSAVSDALQIRPQEPKFVQPCHIGGSKTVS
jgi:hypothetical protein